MTEMTASVTLAIDWDYDVEIQAHLRANHRQDEKNPDQDHHPVGFQPGERGAERLREQPHGDPSAVERWRRQQIEDRQTLMNNAFLKFSASHCAEVSGK